MDHCVRCGHALGLGRFCINCGHPIDQPAPSGTDDDWRVTTAERGGRSTAPPTEVAPAATRGPIVPPTAFAAPPPTRFPLYADEVGSGAPPTVIAGGEPLWTGTSGSAPPSGRAGRSVLPWLAVALVLVIVGAVGVILVVGGRDEPETAGGSPVSQPADSPGTEQSDSPGSPSDGASTPAAPETSSTAPADTTDPTGPQDVASLATATPPATAAPSTDNNGNAVRYDAFNMLDGQPDTAWRMPGSGAGSDVVFTLGSPVSLEEVGMVNGYAKSYPGYDGYSANRRILVALWMLDDGTKVRQRLNEVDTLQTVPVGGVVTSTVTLRILKVSKPGPPPAGRDFTAISDVTLVGTPSD